MNRTKKEILKTLSEGVVTMNQEVVASACKEALEAGIDPYEAIMEGLIKGMKAVNEKYQAEEYFVPEVMLCADALNAGLRILNANLKAESTSAPVDVVLGVMEGDVHDIGKNMVNLMMETSGIKVHDLGCDVPPSRFVEKAEEFKVKMICMSTMMASTMDKMKEVIEILQKQGLRDKYLVMIGGAPVSQSFADSIGADAFYSNAVVAAEKAKHLLSEGL
ncbi:MAG: corrinoid protein [Candidatus Bathyarchaeota archaeon]|nr:corrinoid protein [Candidatus Bathyarchaeota archaeon]